MARELFAVAFIVLLLLAGCEGQPKTNASNTGGGGIGPYQNHQDIQGKSSTNSGLSTQARATGKPPLSGAEVPGNADSPAESNGGTGGSPPAYPSAIAQGKTSNVQNNSTAGR